MPEHAAGTTGVIVVAAGSGSRLGRGIPKALVPVAGRPLVGWAVARAAACPGVSDVVVVGHRDHLGRMQAAYAGCAPESVDLHLVAGGAERTDSVLSGLRAMPSRVDVVLVHDAARALTPTSLFTQVADAVRAGHPAVIPGLPVTDTVKQVDAAGSVVATPDRASLRAIQTPQGFRRDVLERAHLAAAAVTDDAALVERLGLPVLVVPGDPMAHKITTEQDLALVESLARARGVSEVVGDVVNEVVSEVMEKADDRAG